MKTIKDFEQFKTNYQNGDVTLSSNVSYELRNVIEKNDQMRNAQFEESEYPDGTTKLFYNVSRIMATDIFRNTDLDLKDIKVHPLNSYTMKLAPLIRPAIHAYLRLEDFGEDINAFRQELIEQGHILTKEVNGETHIVNLQNIVRVPDMMDLQDGGLIEMCEYSWEDVLKHKKDWEHWEVVERVKAKLDKEQGQKFKIYEWWTVDEYGKKETKGCIKYLDLELLRPTEANNPGGWQPFVELERFATPESMKIRDKKKLKKLIEAGYIEKGKDEMPIYPYEEQRCFTLPGRWLGLGIYELTRGMQEHYNETMNTKRRYDQLNHKGILVHKRSSTGEQRSLTQEFISNLDTGAILDVENDEDLQRLNMGSLVGDFLGSADKIFELTRQVTGVTAQGTGEEIPSATTATVAVINQQTAKSTYDIVIEQQDLFLRRLFEKFKLKSIMEDITSQEWVEISGDPKDLMEMEALYLENYIHNEIIKRIDTGEVQMEVFNLMDKTGLPLLEAQDLLIDGMVDALRNESDKQGGQRFAQITKEMAKDLYFGLEFYVSNESFDVAMRAKAINEALMRPTLTLSREKLEEEWADLLGLSGRRLRKTEEEKTKEMEAMTQAQGTQGVSPQGAIGATRGQANRAI